MAHPWLSPRDIGATGNASTSLECHLLRQPKDSLEQATQKSGLPTKAYRTAFQLFRDALLRDVQKLGSGERLGDREGTVVCIDETFITKKKKQGGGFRGRTTYGHQTLLLAGTEVDLSSRKATGRSFVVVIPNRSRPVRKAEICKRVAAGGPTRSEVTVSLQLKRQRMGHFDCLWLPVAVHQPRQGRVRTGC